MPFSGLLCFCLPQKSSPAGQNNETGEAVELQTRFAGLTVGSASTTFGTEAEPTANSIVGTGPFTQLPPELTSEIAELVVQGRDFQSLLALRLTCTSIEGPALRVLRLRAERDARVVVVNDERTLQSKCISIFATKGKAAKAAVAHVLGPYNRYAELFRVRWE